MARAKKRVLIVEDERPLAEALKTKLLSAGFAVVVAGDGRVGVQKIEEQKFDIVLLDLIMPGLDGVGFLKAIKQKGVHVPVIVLTNLDQDSGMFNLDFENVKDYLVKSDYSITKIIDKINNFL